MMANPLRFPILAFGLRRDGSGDVEVFKAYFDEPQITTITAKALKAGGPVGSVLIDSNGGAWQVRAVKDLGATGSFGERALAALSGNARHRIELDLVETGPLSFEDLKARVCKSIDDNPDDWRDDEAVAGEAEPPRDEQEMLGEVKTEVRKAGSIAEILANLDALWEARMSRYSAPG